MKKTPVLSAVSLYVSTVILTVTAQTTEPSATVVSQGGSSLIGQVLAVVGVVVIFFIIA